MGGGRGERAESVMFGYLHNRAIKPPCPRSNFAYTQMYSTKMKREKGKLTEASPPLNEMNTYTSILSTYVYGGKEEGEEVVSVCVCVGGVFP